MDIKSENKPFSMSQIHDYEVGINFCTGRTELTKVHCEGTETRKFQYEYFKSDGSHILV